MDDGEKQIYHDKDDRMNDLFLSTDKLSRTDDINKNK
jgi:hypothetical protein